jgi:hypothetical protein
MSTTSSVRRSKTKQRAVPQPSRGAPVAMPYEDQEAVAACAKLAGIDHQRADAAMRAADLYWLCALRIEGSSELERTSGVSRAEIAEQRRRHADIFGHRRPKPPDGRRLVLYLRRTVGLSPAEAQRFGAAHARHIEQGADAALVQMRAPRVADDARAGGSVQVRDSEVRTSIESMLGDARRSQP